MAASLLLALLAGTALLMGTPPAAAQEPPGFAVVELFTSEGCSSCPAADAVLNRLAAEEDDQVLLLAMPVDYWNRLGWPDPRSDARFTGRQRHYADLGIGTLFTPAAVVNGSLVVIGSDEAAVRGAIAAARATAPSMTVRLSATWTSTGIMGAIAIDGPSSGWAILVALVEDGVEQDVRRGENAGRHLRHDRICRGFQRLPAAGAWSFPQATACAGPCRVIAFTQQEDSGRILGAAQTLVR